MDLLCPIPAEARWILEALLEDTIGGEVRVPEWASVSAFEHLRTRGPQEHPAYGMALLQWQRMAARFGAEAPRFAAAAFLALSRTETRHHTAARLLELWCRMVPLPVEVAGRLTALDHLPAPEASRVAEDLALGAHENGAPSPGVLQVVSTLQGQALDPARALAMVERSSQEALEPEALLRALAPKLQGEQLALPPVTRRLLVGAASSPGYAPALNPQLEAALAAVRLELVRWPSEGPGAREAQAFVAEMRAYAVGEVLALADPSCRAKPSPHAVLPEADALAKALRGQPESVAVRVALLFPALAGAVERAAGLEGLTHWRAAREPEVAPELAQRARRSLSPVRRKRWDAIAGGAAPRIRASPRPEALLVASLRAGNELARDALLKSRAYAGVLFDSPGGPGLLGADGMLRNGVRSWSAPEKLRVAHPVELFEAERLAWQARLLAPGERMPFNQIFRELHRAGGRELSRKRLDRLSGTALDGPGFELLARRGWFPTISPAEIAPELQLGEVSARLLLRAGPGGWIYDAVEFRRGEAILPLGEVPPRAFSEAWRDVDEALALGLSSASFVPCPARGELMRALAPRLGLVDLRVETDHLAFRAAGQPERITLHNAQPSSGRPAPEAEARTRAAAILPFPDDGGIAALLLGRVVVRAAEEPPRAQPAIGQPERR